jgi:protein-arginine deiminase
VEETKRVRVFKDEGPNGTAILSPGKPTTYVFTSRDLRRLRRRDLKLWVEGLAFATSVRLSLYVGEVERDWLVLEDAPFLLTPHSNRALTNYVVHAKNYCPLESDTYVDRFRRACSTVGVATEVLSSDDVWIEDEMSWGYSQTPRVTMPVALHLYRLHELRESVRALLKPDVGYATAFCYGPDPVLPAHESDSINFGGNIEVTPPVPGYPFGRIYYGSIKSSDSLAPHDGRAFDPRYKKFFDRQKYQPPIELCTDWLSVGHVDEVISFVPTRGGKFALVLASPLLAIKTVQSEPAGLAADPKYHLWLPGVSTVRDLLRQSSLGGSILEYNRSVDFKVFGLLHDVDDPDSIKGRLKAALGLKESEIIEAPVLFWNDKDKDPAFAAVAMTSGLSNLNSMGRFSLVPEPFLGSFKEKFAASLRGVGQTPLWIDDWYVYHLMMGEVHCGSNTRREPFASPWWREKVPTP